MKLIEKTRFRSVKYYYPNCDISRKFCEVLKRKTLDEPIVSLLKETGMLQIDELKDELKTILKNRGL